MVVLRAQQEVDHQDCHGRARDDHESVADKQEAEHVVYFREPDRVHDEVQLDKDGAEGEHTRESHGGQGTQVATGWWDLARDLVCADGRIDNGLLEADPGACEAKGYADDEPDDEHNEHGGERDCAGCSAAPDEEVEQEEGGEDEAGESKGRVEKAQFPGLAVEELVDAGRDVAADEAEERVEDDHDGSEGSAVAGGEEAEECECCNYQSSAIVYF